ncbi:uncharacterized protein [Cebidichthys violaceus]|uniref:uncharacterized protein isoform X1 n=1 Tax=Cebidichthys violaceus TaxID=271503 RepID=UPI0035CAE29D
MLLSDAHPWLRAQCQQTSREPQTFLRTQRVPEPQLQPVAGHPGARISQSLPELQESRLDLRRNRVACSNTKSSFRARLSRPRSSRVRWRHGADWLQRAPRWGTAVNTWRPTSVIQCQESRTHGARGDNHCLSRYHVGPPTERHRFTRGRHFNPNRWVSRQKKTDRKRDNVEAGGEGSETREADNASNRKGSGGRQGHINIPPSYKHQAGPAGQRSTDSTQRHERSQVTDVAPSGGRGSAAGGGPVRSRCSQQDITARDQRVTKLEQDRKAAHSQTTERKQMPRSWQEERTF